MSSSSKLPSLSAAAAMHSSSPLSSCARSPWMILAADTTIDPQFFPFHSSAKAASPSRLSDSPRVASAAAAAASSPLTDVPTVPNERCLPFSSKSNAAIWIGQSESPSHNSSRSTTASGQDGLRSSSTCGEVYTGFQTGPPPPLALSLAPRPLPPSTPPSSLSSESSKSRRRNSKNGSDLENHSTFFSLNPRRVRASIFSPDAVWSLASDSSAPASSRSSSAAAAAASRTDVAMGEATAAAKAAWSSSSSLSGSYLAISALALPKEVASRSSLPDPSLALSSVLLLRSSSSAAPAIGSRCAVDIGTGRATAPSPARPRRRGSPSSPSPRPESSSTSNESFSTRSSCCSFLCPSLHRFASASLQSALSIESLTASNASIDEMTASFMESEFLRFRFVGGGGDMASPKADKSAS
mmetsp:Transcript_16233/g.46781  ORF Transcript_16233/g.46781 Transcript_16233/m.46781 type:complete len:412 (-) Transcript_16233:843-2078(-)